MKQVSPDDTMLIEANACGLIAHLLENPRVFRATKYISEKLTVKATRQGKPDGRSSRETFLVSIGKPNYYERRFIKACQKAGEPFPVRKIQLKFYRE